MTTPEKKIQNKIVHWMTNLEKLGAPVYIERRNAGAFNYKKGIPDLYGIINGYHIEIEVKADNGELSTMQEKFKDRLLKIHCSYICARSLSELQEFIKDKFHIDLVSLYPEASKGI
jgi:hypothetical protein